MFEEDPSPPTSIDPDSVPGRLTLIEERLKAMSIELDSLKARTTRRRHRAVTRQQTIENIVKIGLAAGLMFVLALFLLYAALTRCRVGAVTNGCPSGCPEQHARA